MHTSVSGGITEKTIDRDGESNFRGARRAGNEVSIVFNQSFGVHDGIDHVIL